MTPVSNDTPPGRSAGPSGVLLTNGQLIDGIEDQAVDGCHVYVENGVIKAVGKEALSSAAELKIDLKGKFILPGLIDCHVHVIATTVRLAENALQSDSLITAKSISILKGMLERGFTTVRDAGGADFGLQQAVEHGYIDGPRLVISGKALSQTGGHSDFRGRYDTRSSEWFATRLGALGYAVDGVENLRCAIRQQIKGGANFVKLMVNGGVASPTDPINFLGFAEDEIRAAVEEAEMAQTYVAGHLYTAEAIKRAIRCGLRSVEHATLVDDEGANLIRQYNAVAVPTLIIFEALHRHGQALGFPDEAIAKIDSVRLPGLTSLETLKKAGVTMGFGSDLLGELHDLQSEEFLLRSEVLSAQEIIRSATLDAAKVLQMEDEIGCVQIGANADLLVMDEDPLLDITALNKQGRNMPLIMKGGKFYKNMLN
ncbi:metal-dependent hydrolase family protein [Hoeflea prorocentri]|uniref:Amidohydrolase family protein n=1 Tax=Hoeflea prorocentri TaxID=1922333 RepID=A0A9X3ZK78_9HYPH|nr:amidohydrolase family protein [Hoeflea prorocentri]MCY6383746.1 amidohydrolase family protein [Hoeflea prorocentri]MDA5401546.1 amidohydrolase family protein [Hoeflea prorocentri]